MTPARFRWGIILIQLGILILLANLDVINYNFFFEAAIFIAVVLIFVGIEKIFTKSRLQFISYVTSIGILVVGFAIAYESSMGGSQTSFWSESTFREEYEPGIERIKAILDFDDVGVTIRDAGSDLIYGRFDEYTVKPRIDYQVDRGLAIVKMLRPGSTFLGGAIRIDTDRNRDWYLRFTDQVPLDLECYGEETDVHLNLYTTRLEKLQLISPKSRIYLRLGVMEPQVRVKILGDESSLELRIPEEAGIKISGEDYRSYLLTLGLVESDSGVFTNEGYDTLKTKIEVDLDDQLTSFVLDYF